MPQKNPVPLKNPLSHPQFALNKWAQDKNGDELFWEDKFHAANGKVEACTQGALLYVLLNFVEGGVGRIFFFIFPWFPMCSHYVPFKFPMGSHQVPNMFLKFSMHSPNMFSIAFHFYPLCFGKRCPSSFHHTPHILPLA
jgi:hypothetical protein